MSRIFKAISCLKKQDLHLLWYTLKVANTDRKVFQKPTFRLVNTYSFRDLRRTTEVGKFEYL